MATGALGMDRSLGAPGTPGALEDLDLIAVFHWPPWWLWWLYVLAGKEQTIPAPPEQRCALETWEQTRSGEEICAVCGDVALSGS